MEDKRKIEALDDSVLDDVSGGAARLSDTQVDDEIRLNIFGNEAESDIVLNKNHLQSLVKLFWRH